LNVAGASAPPPRLLALIASPKMLAILLLGAASGFPNQITDSALQAWLKDTGSSNVTIGLMSYVGLPYLLKFLWAPLIDRYPLPFLGRRRGWILAMQLALAATIALFALQNPRVSLLPIGICAVAIAFFSATQDIAYDAWRTEIALPQERGLAAAAVNVGYRACAYIASAVALIVADLFGWRPAFLILAAAMALFGFVTLKAPSTHNEYHARSLRESIVEPLRQLLRVPGAKALIAVVMLFKVGDAFSNRLFTPFMMDVGFSKTEIALIVKALFTGGALLGSVLGGLFMVRLGLLRSMLAFGVLQAVTNLLYCLLAAAGKSYPLMVMAVGLEHIAGAMGGIALVALIMALCDVRYSASQYALLSVLATLPRYALGGPAGWVAGHEGWYIYYVISFLLALPGLIIVWLMRRQIGALDLGRT
jgi:MFS transporter, PAT family, beta-lactamase induction signal transducer AmpG